MARFTVSGRASAAATTVRGPSLNAPASGTSPKIVEIGVFNTTVTDFSVAVARTTAAGTPTGSITASRHEPDSAPLSTNGAGHSADATVGNEIVRATLAAAKGAAMVWTFGGGGLRIPAGTANGIIINCPTGTGQVFDYYIIWDE